MKKVLLAFLMLFISNTSHAQKVGVIIPMAHEAMNEISLGLKSNLKDAIAPENLVFFNAMGDTNNLNTIIQHLSVNPEYSILMPIGTSATSLAIRTTNYKPIISLASSIDENKLNNLRKNGHTNLTNVYDEVENKLILELISKLGKKNVLIVFSNDDRIQKQVDEIKALQSNYNLKISQFSVMNSTDIYSIGSALQDIDCVLVLKDHMIVSMINVINDAAHSQAIPVITSDEGSVRAGADIGIGIEERDIGVVGGSVLQRVLNGTNIDTIPVQYIRSVNLFFRDYAQNKIDFKQVEEIAKQSKLKVMKVTSSIVE